MARPQVGSRQEQPQEPRRRAAKGFDGEFHVAGPGPHQGRIEERLEGGAPVAEAASQDRLDRPTPGTGVRVMDIMSGAWNDAAWNVSPDAPVTGRS
jgi:hypothetical protein